MNTNCTICGKNLTDPISIEHGIGPVCRVRLKNEEMNQGNLFSSRANYDWRIDDDIIAIVDKGGGKTVTNDIDNILKDISTEIPNLDKFQIIYQDSFGIWDGVIVKGARCIQFFSINETEYQKAKEKLNHNS